MKNANVPMKTDNLKNKILGPKSKNLNVKEAYYDKPTRAKNGHRDLSVVNSNTPSFAKIIRTNINELASCKSKKELIDLCHKLLDEYKIDTPWTRKFFYRLNMAQSLNHSLMYVTNAYLRGAGLGMY